MALNIPIIVLAAGTASRFGSPKLAADLGGRPVMQHILSAARDSGLGPTWLVTGSDEVVVLHAADGMADFVVPNREFEDGIGKSIAKGTEACRADADAVIVVLGDQPLVTSDHLADIAATWSGDDAEIIATTFGDTKGPPALFGKATFDDLESLTGDAGARSLFKNGRYTLKTVEFADAASDVDTPADLATLRKSQ